MPKPRLAVLISGSGTNLQAIIDAVRGGALEAEIVLVVSNRSSAHGLERARGAGIETAVFPAKRLAREGLSREQRDAELARLVLARAPDLVVLAGWMLILTPAFLDRFPGRVLNLHPALPGCFPGTEAIRRAHEAFARREIDRTGVMVHWVVPEVDAGDPIVAEEIPLVEGEGLEALEARVHEVEHRLIVEATRRALGALGREKEEDR
jgi:formyltetrahydrofolate-dependent phosphoribosylglycinamide formyltransferase